MCASLRREETADPFAPLRYSRDDKVKGALMTIPLADIAQPCVVRRDCEVLCVSAVIPALQTPAARAEVDAAIHIVQFDVNPAAAQRA